MFLHNCNNQFLWWSPSSNLLKIALAKLPFGAASSLFCYRIRLCVRSHCTQAMLCVKQLLSKLLRLFPYEQPWYIRCYQKSCLQVFQVENRSFLNSLEEMAFFLCVFSEFFFKLYETNPATCTHLDFCFNLDHIRTTSCIALEMRKLVSPSLPLEYLNVSLKDWHTSLHMHSMFPEDAS